MFDSLLTYIGTKVYTNGDNEITGQMNQDALNQIVSVMGYSQCQGEAIPSTNPTGFSEKPVFYIAKTAGTYTNMGGLVVATNETALLINKADLSGWSKITLSMSSHPEIIQDVVEPTFNATVHPKGTVFINTDSNPLTSLQSSISNGAAWLKQGFRGVAISTTAGAYYGSAYEGELQPTAFLPTGSVGEKLIYFFLGDNVQVVYYHDGTDWNFMYLLSNAPSSQQYTATHSTTTAEIWATGAGVTITTNDTTGEISINVPTAVNLKKVQIKLPSGAIDAANNYFIKMSYEDERDFNTSIDNINLPVVLLGGADLAGMSRSNPVLFGPDGYANCNVGISEIAGGDGSDLEITIKDFLLASSQFVTLIFGTH